MLSLIRRMLEKTGNINRSAYTWNAVNACLSAAQCPVILMVMGRTNGTTAAGIFSIGFAVASLMLYVAQYGLRRFQASDINEQYRFCEYHGMRFMTCALMILASAAYCFYGMAFRDYGWEKFLVVFMICILKCIQGYADVLHGHMQQKGRLDVATKASSIRYLAEIIVYCGVLVITRDLLISTAACIGVSVIVLLLTSVNAARGYCDSLRPSITWPALKGLLYEGFPLFVSLFLNMYISNAPKYAIDTYLTDDVQAYYNYIFMPAFMIQLIAHFIFNPILTTYAKLWLSGTMEDFRKLLRLIRRQCVILLGLTALAIAVAFTIGIPVLSLIFGVDLGEFRNELCLLMFGGGMMAYGVFFSTVITIIREQKYLLISYGIAFVAAKLLSGFFVSGYGIMGAVVLYTVIMSALALLLAIVLAVKLKKEAAVRRSS